MTPTPSPSNQSFNPETPGSSATPTDTEVVAAKTSTRVVQNSESPVPESSVSASPADESPADESPADESASLEASGLKGWWKVFASTYVTIFLAEIGDKTQVTTLLMSAESHKPWMVFAGAGTALVCTSLLGVLLGRWLATRLKPRTLEVGAGITLLVITAALGWDIFQGL